MLRRLSAYLFVLCQLLGCQKSLHSSQDGDAASGTFEDVSAEEAYKLLTTSNAPMPVVLDVRSPREFSAGHLKGAKNIDFYGGDFAKQLEALPKDTSYLLHCQSGGRSGKTMRTMKDLGFTTVYHLSDGYAGWVSAGYPTER